MIYTKDTHTAGSDVLGPAWAGLHKAQACQNMSQAWLGLGRAWAQAWFSKTC